MIDLSSFKGLKIVSLGGIMAYLSYFLPYIKGIDLSVILFVVSFLIMIIGTIIHIREHFISNDKINKNDPKQPWE